MSIINQKKKVFGDIAALRASAEGFPQLKVNASFPSINNLGNSMDFLTDLLKSLVGFESLKTVVTNTITHNLGGIEDDIKVILKRELKEVVSCSVNPSIPDRVKHVSIVPSATGVDIELRKLDYLGILLVEPNSQAGNLLYDDVTAGISSTDFNTFLFNAVQDDGNENSWGSVTQPQDILSLTFNSIGPVNNSLNIRVSPYYSDPANGMKLTDVNNDFIDSISLFGSDKMLNSIIDSLFGSISFSIKKSKKQLLREAEIDKVINDIINADETKVIDDSYFSFSNEDARLFETIVENRRNGVVIIEGSNPIESTIPIDSLTTFNQQITTATTTVQKAAAISAGLDDLAAKSAEGVDAKDIYTVKLNFIDNIIKKLMSAIANIVLSPKLIMIYALNHSIVYGTSFGDALDFMKKNKMLIKSILNGIRDAIIGVLLKEVLKAITDLVSKNVIDTQIEKAKAQQAQLASLVGVPQEVLRIIAGLVKS